MSGPSRDEVTSPTIPRDQCRSKCSAYTAHLRPTAHLDHSPSLPQSAASPGDDGAGVGVGVGAMASESVSLIWRPSVVRAWVPRMRARLPW